MIYLRNNFLKGIMKIAVVILILISSFNVMAETCGAIKNLSGNWKFTTETTP